jgi:hypothetical protein
MAGASPGCEISASSDVGFFSRSWLTAGSDYFNRPDKNPYIFTLISWVGRRR